MRQINYLSEDYEPINEIKYKGEIVRVPMKTLRGAHHILITLTSQFPKKRHWKSGMSQVYYFPLERSARVYAPDGLPRISSITLVARTKEGLAEIAESLHLPTLKKR